MDDNDINENVLNLQQREKRAQIMRRYAAKIERSREMAKTHLAPEKNIKKRAYAQARQIVRKRFAGQRGAEYEKLGPTEKMAIDKAIDKKTTLIKKIALKIMPQVKRAEQQRLQSFVKGKALDNHGAPEGGTKKVNEAFNLIYEAAQPKEEPKKKTEKFSEKKGTQIVQHGKFEESVLKALDKKAKKAEIDRKILETVYERGLEAWSEDFKVSQQQYAFARVNSYINQGKTYFNEDSDLHEISDKTLNSYIKKAGEDEEGREDKAKQSRSMKERGEHLRKRYNRIDGIDRANDRLMSKTYTKEDAKIDPKNRELGTDSLTKIYKKDTPGQSVNEENRVKTHNVHYQDGRVEKVRLTDEEAKAMKNHPGVAMIRSTANEAFDQLAHTHTADVKMVKTRNPKTGQAIWRRDKSDKDIIK